MKKRLIRQMGILLLLFAIAAGIYSVYTGKQNRVEEFEEVLVPNTDTLEFSVVDAGTLIGSTGENDACISVNSVTYKVKNKAATAQNITSDQFITEFGETVVNNLGEKIDVFLNSGESVTIPLSFEYSMVHEIEYEVDGKVAEPGTQHNLKIKYIYPSNTNEHLVLDEYVDTCITKYSDRTKNN